MARDGSDNLRQNMRSEQFGLVDPQRFGFAGQADPEVVNAAHPVDHSVKRRISLSTPLWSTQDYLQPEKVERFAAKRPAAGEPPWIVDVGGQRLVWDGHHRVAAALAKGQKTMTVKTSVPLGGGPYGRERARRDFPEAKPRQLPLPGVSPAFEAFKNRRTELGL